MSLDYMRTCYILLSVTSVIKPKTLCMGSLRVISNFHRITCSRVLLLVSSFEKCHSLLQVFGRLQKVFRRVLNVVADMRTGPAYADFRRILWPAETNQSQPQMWGFRGIQQHASPSKNYKIELVKTGGGRKGSFSLSCMWT